MSANGQRFLRAFRQIEGHLRRLTGADSKLSFVEMLRRASRRNPVVRRYDSDLRALVDLRNAIVHDDREFLAEPTDKAVRLIEGIAKHLLQPPRVEAYFRGEVLCVPPDAPIGEAVRLMYEHDYSQVPVVRDDEVVDLLTANTIARWLGASVPEEVFSVSETQIAEVLRYAEEAETWECVARDANLFDVLERFAHHEREGRRLTALLVTHSGKRTEKPLGIITPWDLTRIHRAISESGSSQDVD